MCHAQDISHVLTVESASLCIILFCSFPVLTLPHRTASVLLLGWPTPLPCDLDCIEK